VFVYCNFKLQNPMTFLLRKIGAPILLLLTLSPVPAADLSPTRLSPLPSKAERQLRQVIFSSAEIANGSTFVGSGFKRAFGKSIDEQGFILMNLSGAGATPEIYQGPVGIQIRVARLTSYSSMMMGDHDRSRRRSKPEPVDRCWRAAAMATEQGGIPPYRRSVVRAASANNAADHADPFLHAKLFLEPLGGGDSTARGPFSGTGGNGVYRGKLP